MKVLHVLQLLLLLSVLLSVALAKSSAQEEDAEELEVKYSSKTELNRKIRELNKKRNAAVDEDLTPQERKKLERAEMRSRIELHEVEEEHGEISLQRAAALHALGGSIYKQGRFEELLEMSKEIVHIHEQLEGPESEGAAKALGNLGSVAFRLQRSQECEHAMLRMLYILVKNYGEDSKEVLLHRGRMLTFRIRRAETSMGMS
jgi:hypothetical protein